MKKIFSFIILFFIIGCSSKQTDLELNLKGKQNNFQCKNITAASNNSLLAKIFNNEKFIILYPPKGINCNVYIKNITNKKITDYTDKLKIIYDKKHPRCIYYKQNCVIKGNYYFCSETKQISFEEYKKIKHFKYKFQNLYINNPNSNISYKIFSKCKPLFLDIKCKKFSFNIDNKYYLNKKLIYLQNDSFIINPCENLDNEIFYNEINYLTDKTQNLKTKIKESLTKHYTQYIKEFIYNNFPHTTTIKIDLSKIEAKNKQISKIYNKLIENKKVDYTDLNLIENYSKQLLKEKKLEEYIKAEILKFVIYLKLNIINTRQKQKKAIKEIDNLIFLCKKSGFNEYIGILNRLKNIINNLVFD